MPDRSIEQRRKSIIESLVAALDFIPDFGWTIALLALLLACSVVLSLGIGPVRIPAREIISALAGAPAGNHTDGLYSTVLFSVRLPRIVAAVVSGWALALAGLCYQSLLKNPLASEYTLGVSSGAAIGAILAALLPHPFAFSGPLFAFLGSMTAMVVVWFIAGLRMLPDNYSLVLTGIILTAFGSAVLSLLLSIISPNQLHAFFFWFMGSFAMAEWSSLRMMAPLVFGTSMLILFYTWEMNAMSLNDEWAQQVGIPVRRIRMILYVSAGILTALTVSIAGTIGFIGLVVPHFARMFTGADNRLLFFVAPLLGAIFCVLADLVSRCILAPAELPVGVVTAFIGVPVFLFLLARRAS